MIQDIPALELSLIGNLLKGQAPIDEVVGIVSAPQFFTGQYNRTIFEAVLGLYNSGEPIDLMTVLTRVQTAGTLEQSGGRAYMVEAMESVHTNYNILAHCEIIAEQYRLRTFGEKFGRLIDIATEPGAKSSDVMSLAEKALLEIQSVEQIDVTRLMDVAQQYANNVLQGRTKQENRWIETRVADMNNKIMGFWRGDMTIIGGPPSMGKTKLALDTCLFNMNWNRKTLFISLDQTEESLVLRMLTSMTGISKRDMYSKLTPAQQDDLSRNAARLSLCDGFWIADRGDQTVIDIRSLARRIKRLHGLDVLVIDYVQMIPEHRRFENRNLALAEISRVLKATAKELDCVLICLSQVNRGGHDRPIDPVKGIWGFPDMSDLRDSGALEQDANVIIFPWVPYELCKKRFGEQSQRFADIQREVPGIETLAYMIVAKNKDGWTGTIECRNNPERMQFYSEDSRHV